MEQEFEYYPPKIEEARVIQQNKIEQILKSIHQKYSDGGAKLKVYVDEEENKYYITVYAAFSLDFITYKKATKLSDSGQELFEISSEVLHVLKIIFGDGLVYEKLPSKKIADVDPIKYRNYMDETNLSKYDNFMTDEESIQILNASHSQFSNNRLR